MIIRSFLFVASLLSALAADAEQSPHCFDEAFNLSAVRESAQKFALEDFKALDPNSKREEVLAQIGAPSYFCGSGIPYDVYLLNDGRSVWVTYLAGKISIRVTESAENPNLQPIDNM